MPMTRTSMPNQMSKPPMKAATPHKSGKGGKKKGQYGK